MTRFRRILATAAALFGVGGITLAVAIQQANVADADPLTCAEWQQIQAALPSELDGFVAVADAFSVPVVTASGRVLGECAVGACAISVGGCGGGPVYSYRYTKSQSYSGYRLFKISAHRYVINGWRDLASEN